MARNSRSNGSGSSKRRKRDGQQGSGKGKGRGWHGAPEEHAAAARGEQIRSNNSAE